MMSFLERANMNPDLLIVIVMVILFISNIPFYLYLGTRFFGNRAKLWEAIRISFSQSFFSLLILGEFHDDFWKGLKVGVYFTSCSLILALEYVGVFLWIKSRG